MGGPEFFGVVKGEDQFFSVGQRRDQNVFLHPMGLDQIFFTKPKGGPDFFYCRLRGNQIFYCRLRGRPDKIGDWPSQTDAPLPVKNDSSLMNMVK